jgi:predicted transcriptional regulator
MPTTTKTLVREVLSKLPDDCTVEDVQYQLYVISKVRKGLAEIKQGKGVPQAEVRKRMQKWLAR